jgi:mannonate dehydratase
MPLFSLAALQRAGLLQAGDIEPLSRVREHNPLLFDLVLKRRLRADDVSLPASVFEGAALRSTDPQAA